MRFEPHAYQGHAIDALLRNEEQALFLEPGLGKTSITLTAIQDLVQLGQAHKALVVAPLRVARQVWTDEADKWDHLRGLRISRVLGTAEERLAALERDADVYVVNRENVVWLVRHFRSDWPFDMVVLDELSSFKSPSAKRFRALRAVRPYMKRVVGLTATPAPNGLLDLWSQIYLLDRGQRLGGYTGYRARYFTQDWRGEWQPLPSAEQKVFGRIADLCVSMRAEDWLEMPDLTMRTVNVQMPEAATAAYERFERELLIDCDETNITVASGGVLAGKLMQFANGAVYDDAGGVQEMHEAKLDALEELVEAQSGNPLLVFYAYRHDAARIVRRIPWAKTLDGEESIRDWNAGRTPLLLAHPASAGHGLNLQEGGHQAAWFGLTWNLELYQQAIGRLWRQGQRHPVIVHHLIAQGTIDEDVMRALGRKAKRQDALLDAVRYRARRARVAADQTQTRREA